MFYGGRLIGDNYGYYSLDREITEGSPELHWHSAV